MESEANVTELCERFGLDRRPSSSHNESLPVSTAVCERGLSTINVIATKTGNQLLVKTISNLFFLSLVCPTQAKFEPAKHIRECLDCRRNGDDMRGRKVVECIIIVIIVLPPVACQCLAQPMGMPLAVVRS